MSIFLFVDECYEHDDLEQVNIITENNLEPKNRVNVKSLNATIAGLRPTSRSKLHVHSRINRHRLGTQYAKMQKN